MSLEPHSYQLPWAQAVANVAYMAGSERRDLLLAIDASSRSTPDTDESTPETEKDTNGESIAPIYLEKPPETMPKIGSLAYALLEKEIGTAIPTNDNTYPVKGRDLRSGTPKEVNITEEDTAEALNDILKEMVDGIKDALEATPPELSADLVDMGLTLTGGGALLKNKDKRFSKETGLPVHIAEDPLSCVAIGTGKALDQEQTFSTMLTEY